MWYHRRSAPTLKNCILYTDGIYTRELVHVPEFQFAYAQRLPSPRSTGYTPELRHPVLQIPSFSYTGVRAKGITRKLAFWLPDGGTGKAVVCDELSQRRPHCIPQRHCIQSIAEVT